jgi:TPR repeat protein
VESAQFTVATMLFYGQGVAVDKAKAKKWFQKAAAQGCKDSQNYLNSWVDD